MTTHIGKIGRLPKDRRHELGQRIENGQPGTEIVHWLNQQPDVQSILQQHFAGRPISEQNLSDWKQAGHVEWLRRQEAREAALHLLEQADDLDEAIEQRHLSDRFATIFASEMTRLAMALLEQDADPEKRWKRLCDIHRELSQLRRDDYRAVRTTIQQERWEREIAQAGIEEARREKQAHKERLIEMIQSGQEQEFNARLFGGGEAGRKRAEMLYRLKCDLPLDDVLDGTWSKKFAPAPAPKKEKPAPPANAEKSPANPPRSTLIKTNPPKKSKLNPAGSKPIKTAGSKKEKESKTSPTQKDQPPHPEVKPLEPALDQPSVTASDSSHQDHDKSIHHSLAAPEHNVGGLAAPKRSDGGEFVIQPAPSEAPSETPLPPQVPVPAPEQAAYNQWFRMNRGAESFDQESLEKLYAAIPPKET